MFENDSVRTEIRNLAGGSAGYIVFLPQQHPAAQVFSFLFLVSGREVDSRRRHTYSYTESHSFEKP